MEWMKRLRGLGALGVALYVVAECSLIGHASPRWSLAAGHMSEARELPEAVVLNDGRVLFIGGVRVGAVSPIAALKRSSSITTTTWSGRRIVVASVKISCAVRREV